MVESLWLLLCLTIGYINVKCLWLQAILCTLSGLYCDYQDVEVRARGKKYLHQLIYGRVILAKVIDRYDYSFWNTKVKRVNNDVKQWKKFPLEFLQPLVALLQLSTEWRGNNIKENIISLFKPLPWLLSIRGYLLRFCNFSATLININIFVSYWFSISYTHSPRIPYTCHEISPRWIYSRHF